MGSLLLERLVNKREKGKEIHTSLVRAQTHDWGNFGFAKQKVEKRGRSYTGSTRTNWSRTRSGVGSHLGSGLKTLTVKKQ